jgi:hypothetical protein
MAEIAIPLIALGSMYIMSNQDKTNKTNKNYKEGLTNMTQTQNELPGVNPPMISKNYPVASSSTNPLNVNKYSNPNQTTDKYFDQNNYSNIEQTNSSFSVGGSTKQNYSLTGNAIDTDKFKHNNMVPFFGAKIKGATVDMNSSESFLDNMQGSGSQQIKKQEQAPMFQPIQNMQYANGSPNMSDFIQSRVNPSMRMANVKPWEEERVGPGLNKGFTTEGSNGFNSGMEARDSWLPKTVNELRVDTNPKITFGLNGHEGPAASLVKNAGTSQTQGKVEKNRPDTYYNVGQERWFTTTGVEKAQTARGVEVLQDVNRTTTSAQYFGLSASNIDATYSKGEYENPKRHVLEPDQIPAANASGRYMPTEADYGIQGYSSLPNNRSTTKHVKEFGGVSGVVSAIMSPILDILRPSRKENVIGNIRSSGNPGAIVSKGTVFNPADRPKTTIKEMTVDSLDFNHLNYQNQNSTGYLVSEHQPVHLQRDTTNTSYSGVAGPNEQAASMSYESAYMQHNNVNKTYLNHPNQGGTQIFNQNDNISIHRRDEDRVNNRTYARNAGPVAFPSAETHGKISGPQTYNQINCERNSPDILTAFKNNPYTQSLNSWA